MISTASLGWPGLVDFEPLQCGEALVGADELDSHRWPTVGCAWMSKGTHLEVATPGQNQQHDLAGALDLAPGTLLPWVAARKPNARGRDLLTRLDAHDPTEHHTRLSTGGPHTHGSALVADLWSPRAPH